MAQQGSLIYSLVARGTTVLAEYTKTSGNFATVTRRILDKIPAHDMKMSYVYDRHIFHYIVEDGLVFMTMADEEFGRRVPFSFLADIKNRFKSSYGDRAKTALAYGMNEDFSRVLEKQMDYYNNNPNADRLTRVRGEIDEVKSVMVSNIEKVLERGERIELLVDKSSQLSDQAFQFKRKSTTLKRAMWWKNAKLTLIIALIVIFVIFVIVLIACGGFKFSKCKSKDKNDDDNKKPSSSPTPEPSPTPEARVFIEEIFDEE